MIKRIIGTLLGVFLISGCGLIYNDISYCQYLGGYWGSWENYYEYNNGWGYGTKWSYQGKRDNFVVFEYGKHPSDFSYRISITSFDDKSLPKGEWKEYRGYVEYHTNHPVYSSGDSEYFVKYTLPYLSCSGEYVIRRPATIGVNRGSQRYTYNVLFDNVGFGVTIPWKYSKDY